MFDNIFLKQILLDKILDFFESSIRTILILILTTDHHENRFMKIDKPIFEISIDYLNKTSNFFQTLFLSQYYHCYPLSVQGKMHLVLVNLMEFS